MQTYLKTKPVFVQFFLFLGMAMGIFIVFMLIGSLILSKITGLGLVALADTKSWDWKDPNMIIMVRGFILLQFLGLFLIPSLLYGYLSDPKPMRYLGLHNPSKHIYWLLGIAVMVVSIPFVEYSGILNKQLIVQGGGSDWMKGMEDDAARTIQFMLGNHTVSNLLINLVFISLFAGIGEELFFRGIIQRLLIRAFKNPWWGIVIAGFLFSLFHFQFYGFIPRFLLGILLGAIYWYSGSLWPSIIAHFFYDGFIIVLAYFNPSMIENPDASIFENTKGLIPMALVSLVATIAIVMIMKKNSVADYNEIYRDDLPQPPENNFSF
jgi:uncharacterized protein